MIVVGRPGYRIDCRTIKGGALDELLDHIIHRELKPLHPCIMFLGSCWVIFVSIRAMVILMTSLSSSKTEFACVFYDVFDVGGYAGSSLLEVSLLSC